MKKKELAVSAPGRICLFGEHQDYLGLPVIPAAINLRVSIHGKKRKDQKLSLDLPDIGEKEAFSFSQPFAYSKERDYLKSAVNVLRRKGVHLSSGWDCLIHGTIPINSGTASSSALVVAWIKFLLESASDPRANDRAALAELGFLSEVAEFKEPGGKMDHYASALGGVVSVHFDEPLKVRSLYNPLKEFVLADSLERKDTTRMIGTIKTHVLRAADSIKKRKPGFNLKLTSLEEIRDEMRLLPKDEKRFFEGTLLTRDLTSQGEALFAPENFDDARFGMFLSKQHAVLRDHLQILTPKIEKMIEASLKAGALGAKSNGSGGGGCMFAYTPRKSLEVAESLKKIGAETHIIRIDEGVRCDEPE